MSGTTRPAREPRFVIALFDAHDPAGSTVHVFDDPALWAWLNRAETFVDGAEGIDVVIPGTGLVGFVSAVDPVTDKAQHLAWLPGGRGRRHPAVASLDLGPSDTAEFREAYDRLMAEVGPDRVVEGRW